MEKKYIVKLIEEERKALKKIISNGNETAKRHKIAQILLLIDTGEEGKHYRDAQVTEQIAVSVKTVSRIRQKYVAGGLKKVFEKKFTPRPSRRKFDGEKEAQLIALCCSETPEGYSSWSLRLLADRLVQMKIVDKVSPNTVHQTLKKTKLNHGKK